MLRYFAFPDRVERISSYNDRRKILEAFGSASHREVTSWKDRQLDDKATTPPRLETMCRAKVDVLAFASPRDIFPPRRAESGRARVLFVIRLIDWLRVFGRTRLPGP
jgi:hypothetical protein